MTPEALLELLTARGIAWQIIEHEPVWTMADAQKVSLPPDCQLVKNLLITDDKETSFALVTLPGQARVHLQALRPLLSGRRLTFASAQALNRLLGLTPGSVTPFGLLGETAASLPWMVPQALKEKTIGLHPLRNTATLCVNTNDVASLLEDAGVQVIWI